MTINQGHNPEQIREFVRDSVTDKNGNLRPAGDRFVHCALLLQRHSNSNEPLYSIARFLQNTDLAPLYELDAILDRATLTEQQRYRLEYALRVLRGLT
jgi:hypothetical protein